MEFLTPVVKPARRFGVYFLAVIIFFVFYFQVAGAVMGKTDGLAAGFTDPEYTQLVDMMIKISTRTACGIAGIMIGMLLIREPFSRMIQIPKRSVLLPFLGTFSIFTLLLLAKDFIAGLATNNTPILNKQLLSQHSGVYLLSLLFGILMTPIHALTEEIVFRSFTAKGFAALFNRRWFVMLVSGILFSLNHGGQDLTYWLLLSILLMITVFKSNSIIYAWGIHTAHNFYFMQIMGGGDVAESSTIFYQRSSHSASWIELIVIVVVIAIIGIYNHWRWSIADVTGRAYTPNTARTPTL